MPRSALEEVGFGRCGDPVFVDANAFIYAPERIAIGDHVRIDAAALLTPARGAIELGNRVHLSAATQLYGGGGIVIEDFACVSARATILSLTDDFAGPFLAGPMVPDELRHISAAPVRCERHSLVGAGAVVLPGVTVGRGAAVGALSLVREDVPPGAIVVGTPARRIGKRDVDALEELARRVED